MNKLTRLRNEINKIKKQLPHNRTVHEPTSPDLNITDKYIKAGFEAMYEAIPQEWIDKLENGTLKYTVTYNPETMQLEKKYEDLEVDITDEIIHNTFLALYPALKPKVNLKKEGKDVNNDKINKLIRQQSGILIVDDEKKDKKKDKKNDMNDLIRASAKKTTPKTEEKMTLEEMRKKYNRR